MGLDGGNSKTSKIQFSFFAVPWRIKTHTLTVVCGETKCFVKGICLVSKHFFFNHLILTLMHWDNNLVIIDLSLFYDTDEEIESKKGRLTWLWLGFLQDKNPGFLAVNDWVLHPNNDKFPEKKYIFPYCCNGKDIKQDTLSIANQKKKKSVNHSRFSVLSGNIVPMISFIYIIVLVYRFGQTFWHGLYMDVWLNIGKYFT